MGQQARLYYAYCTGVAPSNQWTGKPRPVPATSAPFFWKCRCGYVCNVHQDWRKLIPCIELIFKDSYTDLDHSFSIFLDLSISGFHEGCYNHRSKSKTECWKHSQTCNNAIIIWCQYALTHWGARNQPGKGLSALSIPKSSHGIPPSPRTDFSSTFIWN